MKKAAFLILAVAAGWLAGSFLPLRLPHPLPSPVPLAKGFSPPPLLAVPDVRQSTGYTCGAAALQAILAYWGTEEREDRLAARLHSTPEAGTHPLEILRVAREFGLTAELHEGLDLSDLERALAAGTTVIVDLQAWRDQTVLPWSKTWDDGHYMVLLGADRENLYFEDPSLLGERGVIPRQEFVERWHDYEGDPPLDPTDRTFVHAAIFITGSRPASGIPASFRPVR